MIRLRSLKQIQGILASKFLTPARPFLTLLILAVLLGFIGQNSLSAEITFGGEFELSNAAMKNGPRWSSRQIEEREERRQQLKLVEHMREHCISGGCRVEEVKGKWASEFRVVYPDGWWFQISLDPYCVEVIFKPSTHEELKTKAPLINEDIFAKAGEVGLTVIKPDNSHFNFGVNSAFEGSAEEFLRFFVDYANRADLALGSLGKSPGNAPPLATLKASQRAALQRIVRRFYAGKLSTVSDAVFAIMTEVYTDTLVPRLGARHAQALGLKHIHSANLTERDAPVELRAMWIQDSAENFNKIAELFSHRIRWLAKQKEPIYYAGGSLSEFSSAELKARFFIYLAEMDLRFTDYQELLPQEVREAQWDAFVNPNADLAERVRTVERYWDMIDYSPWARREVVNVLSAPGAWELPQTQELMRRLEVESTSTYRIRLISWIKNVIWGRVHREPFKVEIRSQVMRRNSMRCIDIFANAAGF